jgi:hypothetical protein
LCWSQINDGTCLLCFGIISHTHSLSGLLDALQGEVFAVDDRRTNIRVKKMGEIDSKAFRAAWMKRLPQEADELSPTLVCSKWQQKIQNSEWYPFKIEVVDEKPMV